MTLDGNGELVDQSGLITKVKNMIRQEFQATHDPLNCDFHYTTKEVFEKLQGLLPSEEYDQTMVSVWLHEAGFTFYDFGELQYEWLFKRI
jgi:hypothetical protein